MRALPSVRRPNGALAGNIRKPLAQFGTVDMRRSSQSLWLWLTLEDSFGTTTGSRLLHTRPYPHSGCCGDADHTIASSTAAVCTATVIPPLHAVRRISSQPPTSTGCRAWCERPASQYATMNSRDPANRIAGLVARHFLVCLRHAATTHLPFLFVLTQQHWCASATLIATQPSAASATPLAQQAVNSPLRFRDSRVLLAGSLPFASLPL